MTEKLLISRTENIVTITFNRPEFRNALDNASQSQFLEVIKKLVQDETIQVLILTGAGTESFCAGGDITEHEAWTTETHGLHVSSIMAEALMLLENASFPSIAAVNGFALGGGCEIALACDMRIVDEHVKMGMVQLRLGLTPGWGTGQRLIRLIGYGRAMDMLLSTHIYTASELQQLGLANRIVEGGQAFIEATAFAHQIARWDASAVKAVKRILRYGLTLPYDEAIRAEMAEFPPLWAGDAHLKAVAEFLKR